MTPVSELSPSAFRDLLGQTSFRTIRGGARVYRQGERDDWTLFLLEGSLELKLGNRLATLHSGHGTAKGPIGAEQPRRENARALSDCTIAKVPTSLLDMLMDEPRTSVAKIEVTELSDHGESLQEQLLLEIYEDYANEALRFPSLPDVVLRLREAVENPNATAKAIERIVTADAAVAARLIQVANSAAYAGAARVESCKDAIIRLGFAATRELVTSIVLRHVFTTSAPVLKQTMRELWKHSTSVAAISYHLAKVGRVFDPDRALLAGLIHDIGALPVLGAAARLPGAAQLDAEGLTRCVENLQAQVGSMVLRHWEFPDDLVTVALEAEDWERTSPETTADYCDLVLVAQLFSFMGTPHIAKCPSLSIVPAFQRLTLGEISPEDTLNMLEDARQDIEDLQRVVSG